MTPHRFRHTYATELLEEGRFTIYDVKTLLRHSSLQTTEMYLHVTDPQLQAKVQRRARQEGTQAAVEAEAGAGADG